MIRLRVLSAFVLFGLFLAACNHDLPEEESALVEENLGDDRTQMSFDLSVAVTLGNHTYIPLNVKNAMPKDYVEVILELLDTFERAHPELEMISWKVEWHPSTYDLYPYIYGIWIDHRPRP